MPVKTGKKQASGFQKGKSGNPLGRPKGARNRTTLAVEALLDGEAKKLTRTAIDHALAGDMTALKLCLDRICPPTRDRVAAFPIPALHDATDLPNVVASIIASVAEGDLGISEAEALLRLVDGYRHAIDTAEIERRISTLEAAFVQNR